MDRRKLVRASPAVAKSIVSGTVLFLVYEEALPSSPCRSGPTTRGRLYTLGSVAAAGAAAGLDALDGRQLPMDLMVSCR